MADTYTVIKLGVAAPATGSAENIITVPTGEKRIVKEILICNPTATDSTVDIWAVPSGGTADDTNIIFSNVAVAADDTIILEASTVLEEAEKLTVKTVTGGVCTYRVSGVKVTSS